MTRLADLVDADGASRDAPLVHWRGATWTRGEILDAADRLAGTLVRMGVSSDSAVAALVPSTPLGVVMLFAIWRVGAVAAPLNPRLPAAAIDRLVAETRPAVVVRPSLDEASLVPQASVWPGTPRRYEPGVALVMTTSGTTGPPKRVLLAHASIVGAVDSALAKIRGGPTPTAAPPRPERTPMPNLVPMPLALWSGVYNLLFAARVGAAVVLCHPFDTREFAAAVREHGCTSTVLAPPMLAMLLDDAGVTSLAPLRYVRSGTAPLSPLVAQRFRARFGVTVLNSYGQTELGGEIVGWSAGDAREFGDAKLGSVGRPHDGIEVRIVRPDGATAAIDETGEIWARSPFVMQGYAGDRLEVDTRLDPDGFLRTGDLGRLDADGFLWVDGRCSDVINRGGLKVHPIDVEEALRADPAVADVCVAGVPDARLGEVPWAWVVPAAGATVDPVALTARVRDTCAPYAVPTRVVEVAELPRNEVGKVLRHVLVERAAAADPPSPADGAP